MVLNIPDSVMNSHIHEMHLSLRLKSLLSSNIHSIDVCCPMVSRRNGRISAESPFQELAKTSESTKQDFRLISFLALMTLGCAHVLCFLGRMESPGICYSYWGGGGETLQLDKREACAKAC